MKKALELNAGNFQEEVIQSKIPVLVDFWAPWCGPCRSMAPAFEEAAQSFPLKAQFVKINTEEHPTLSGRFSIRSIPTIIAFKNNRIVDQISGALPASQIIAWVHKHL